MSLIWQSDFSSLDAVDRDFVFQSKDPTNPNRRSIVDGGPFGKALRLTTQPGDIGVAGSGPMERCDEYRRASPSTEAAQLYSNVTQWWRHWFMLPDDFQGPTWQAYVLFDFHESPNDAKAANFHLNFIPREDVSQPGLLCFSLYSGDPNNPTEHRWTIGPPKKTKWYDFIYHVRWSSGLDGYLNAWVDGMLTFQYKCPTLYPGHRVYVKLPNYHYPDGSGLASSVIHGGLRLASSWDSIAA